MRQNFISSNTATFASALRAGLAAGLLLGAALLVTPARADDTSLEGQIAQARFVGQISSTLNGYSHHVDSLAQSLPADMRGRVEAAATADHRRLVWFVSALRSSATAVEADEYAAVQQMVAVYNEMHERIATSARAGDMSAAARQAQLASGVAHEIGRALQQISSRSYTGMFETAALIKKEQAVEVAPVGSRVATIQ